MKKIELSEHFTYSKLLRYSLPAIGQTLAISSFQVVDGFFVSRFLGVTAFSAVNIVSPAFFLLYYIGYMLGAGTSALVSKLRGEGEDSCAEQVFTMSVAFTVMLGIVLGLLTTVLVPKISVLIGASPADLPYCVSYGQMLTAFLPAYLINSSFLTLWITAEKALIGMIVAIINGGANALLDWLFMGPLNGGVKGAALATSLAAVLSAVITLVYFCRKNNSSLRFVRFPLRQVRDILKICSNGVGEMIDDVIGSITQLMMNVQLMRLFGEVGVAAMGVYSYVIEFFLAFFYGISTTAITVVGYKYGEQNKKELDSLVRKNTIIMLVSGALMFLLCFLLARPIADIYLDYNAPAFELATKVLRISAFSCLAFGFVVFSSALFTGLNDGLTASIIAISNALVMPLIMIYLLPALFGPDGIWFATPVAVVISAGICIVLLRFRYPKRVSFTGKGG